MVGEMDQLLVEPIHLLQAHLAPYRCYKTIWETSNEKYAFNFSPKHFSIDQIWRYFDRFENFLLQV